MTLNINTLKLDIEYLQDGLTLSHEQRAQVENQLVLFIQESLSELTLSKLPASIQSAQQNGVNNITLSNIEIFLPTIDAQAFLQGRASYFKKLIEPALERIIYDGLQVAANKGLEQSSMVNSQETAVHESEDAWWQSFQQVLHFNLGPLAFAHQASPINDQAQAILPRLLNCIGASKARCEYFKQSLLTPHTFKRIYKWLHHNKQWSRILQEVFKKEPGDSLYDHSMAVSYLEQADVSDAHKKHFLKHYLELNIITASQSKKNVQSILELYSKIHRLLMLNNHNGLHSAAILANLHESMLMGQSETWLKHCQNWLAVVMHQGVSARDMDALLNVLKRAKGSHWLKLPVATKQAPLIREGVSQSLSPEHELFSPHSLHQLRHVYHQALALLSPLNDFGADINALWEQLSKIKWFLQGPGKALNTALTTRLKNTLQALSESQASQENERPYLSQCLKARVDQVLTELNNLLTGEGDLIFTSPDSPEGVGLLLKALNELALSPWLPISVKQQLDKIATLLTGQEAKLTDIKSPLRVLHDLVSTELLKWLACLPALLNVKPRTVLGLPISEHLNQDEHPPEQDSLELLLNLAALLPEPQVSCGIQTVKKNLALSLLAIMGLHYGPKNLQQDLAQLIARPNKEQAIALVKKAKRNAPQIQYLQALSLGVDDPSPSMNVYHQEQSLQTETQKILVGLLTQLIPVEMKSVIGGIHYGEALHFLNKQQLYVLLSQVIVCIKGASDDLESKGVQQKLQALVALKNKLTASDNMITQVREPWWLPLVQEEGKEGTALFAAPHEGMVNERVHQKKQQELQSRLQICTLSLQSHASVLDLSRARHSRQSIDALMTVILAVCECLAAVNLNSVFAEASAHKETHELKQDFNKWALTSLGFLQTVPQVNLAVLSINDKQKVTSLMDCLMQCVKLNTQDAWQKIQLNTCQTALQRLADLADKRPAGLGAQQIHELIWSQDLTRTQAILKQQPQSFLMAKKSELLLNHHRQKVQALIPKEKIMGIYNELKDSLQQLSLTPAQQGTGLMSLDGGLVLIWPYLKDFFKNNQLIQDDDNNSWIFVNETARATAHALLVAALGFKQDENTWMVANLLCGYEVDTWFDEPVELSLQQLSNCEKLLQAVIHNWPALKSMPVQNFRELFLQRSAQLYENQEGWCIEVAPNTMDVLLTKLPWGLGYLSLPWLGKALIQVKWQYGF